MIHAMPPGDEGADRLSPDDQAARTTEQLQAGALLAQQLRAQGGAYIHRGVCCNCGARCMPSAVYCDAECRADHEGRLAVQGRQRLPRGA